MTAAIVVMIVAFIVVAGVVLTSDYREYNSHRLVFCRILSVEEVPKKNMSVVRVIDSDGYEHSLKLFEKRDFVIDGIYKLGIYHNTIEDVIG